jgi:hypothetical protein
MRNIECDYFLTGVEAAKHFARTHAHGAKEVRVVAMNGFACLRKCGRGYKVIE